MNEKIWKSLAIATAAGLFLFQGCAWVKTAAKTDELVEPAPAVSEADRPVPDAPKISQFILGPGDKVEITVYRNDDLKLTVQIDPSGKISYPFMGDVQAAGLTIFQLRDGIRDGLSKYIVNPQVYVNVTSVQSQKIIVLGEVKSPGFFQIDSSTTTLEAISNAGGFTLDGKQNNVLLIRGGARKPQIIQLNLAKAFSDGDMAGNQPLQRGDILYVPRTTISDVNRFFSHLSTIISPFLQLETGYFVGQQIERGGSAVISTK
ncbi:MAG: polysaccharide export protein [Deltaproteobacteria bacterium]|nr:polysaccharide export protein [Deltaproteobacteria bacterium]